MNAPKQALKKPEFIALMAMSFATIAFTIDAMLPALPQIGQELTPDDLNKAQLVLTSFVLGMGFFILGLLAFQHQGEMGWQANLLGHVSMRDHLRAFAAGVVDTRHVVFYLSLTGLFLFLTLKVLESRRWR